METFTYKTAEETVLNFARYIAREADSGKSLNIALSGGRAPKLLFEILSIEFKEIINWEHIHFYWGDERCVPPDHGESNYGSANNLLFRMIDAQWNVHRIIGENEPEEEAERYSDEITKNVPIVDGLPKFDLIMLGLGEDGHTASIFPNQMELLKADSICAVAVHPDSGQKRITLTGNVINNASVVAFLVTGQEKAERVSEIINEREVARQYPAFAINPGKGELIWYLDEAAASLIE